MCLVTGNLHFIESTPFALARETLIRVGEGKARWLKDSGGTGLGALSIKEEPGKKRIFAMVDSVTQWVLYPLHEALFTMLGKIAQDGTFDQMKPIKSLLAYMSDKGLEHVYSYDLSAATDRIPVSLQEILLGYLASPTLAYTWRKFLCERYYRLPRDFCTMVGAKALKAMGAVDSHGFLGSVRYAVGQPMGAYSSWAMLAFVHHALVQFAAYRAGHRGWFVGYAVLGDDVVIADHVVASKYVAIMKEIGVGIGFHKSVISNNRSLEFAKRFVYKGEEVTPLPLIGLATGWLGVSMVPEVISVVERITGKVLSIYQIARYMGVGYKAASGGDNRQFSKLPRKLRSLLILLTHPGAPRGAATLLDWLKLKSLTSRSEIDQKGRDSLVCFLVDWCANERFPRLLRLLDSNLKKFVPSQSGEASEGLFKEYANWFKLYITEPLEQDFMVLRMEVEAILRSISPIVMPSDNEVNSLLEAVEAFEDKISAIPKEVVRHKSQLAETSIPLLPNLVKRWSDLGKYFGRSLAQARRIKKRVSIGVGASPLLRTK
jgi:hypothetical protein